MTKKNVEKNSFELIRELRHSLGLIDVADLERKEESEQDRRDYCAAIFAIFPRLKKDLYQAMSEQWDFTMNKAEIWEQSLLGRGGFSMADVLLKKWETAANEYVAKSKDKKEEFDKHSPLPEI